ncbi:hypothetical protein BB560_000345, partial [Smittium megazygosporum]
TPLLPLSSKFIIRARSIFILTPAFKTYTNAASNKIAASLKKEHSLDSKPRTIQKRGSRRFLNGSKNSLRNSESPSLGYSNNSTKQNISKTSRSELQGKKRGLYANSKVNTDQTPEDEARTEAEEEGVVRCICNGANESDIMIQCDKCNVWQHTFCMGIKSQKFIPEKYYCEECKEEDHPYINQLPRSIALARQAELWGTTVTTSVRKAASAAMAAIANQHGSSRQRSNAPASKDNLNSTKHSQRIKTKTLKAKASSEDISESNLSTGIESDSTNCHSKRSLRNRERSKKDNSVSDYKTMRFNSRKKQKLNESTAGEEETFLDKPIKNDKNKETTHFRPENSEPVNSTLKTKTDLEAGGLSEYSEDSPTDSSNSIKTKLKGKNKVNTRNSKHLSDTEETSIHSSRKNLQTQNTQAVQNCSNASPNDCKASEATKFKSAKNTPGATTANSETHEPLTAEDPGTDKIHNLIFDSNISIYEHVLKFTQWKKSLNQYSSNKVSGVKVKFPSTRLSLDDISRRSSTIYDYICRKKEELLEEEDLWNKYSCERNIDDLFSDIYYIHQRKNKGTANDRKMYRNSKETKGKQFLDQSDSFLKPLSENIKLLMDQRSHNPSSAKNTEPTLIINEEANFLDPKSKNIKSDFISLPSTPYDKRGIQQHFFSGASTPKNDTNDYSYGANMINNKDFSSLKPPGCAGDQKQTSTSIPDGSSKEGKSTDNISLGVTEGLKNNTNLSASQLSRSLEDNKKSSTESSIEGKFSPESEVVDEISVSGGSFNNLADVFLGSGTDIFNEWSQYSGIENYNISNHRECISYLLSIIDVLSSSIEHFRENL